MRVREEALAVLREHGTLLPSRDLARVVNEVSDEVVGLGPIESLLRDPEVSEVMVNGADDVYVERKGRIERVGDGLFEGEEAVLHLIERIVAPLGLRVDESSPWVDARLPDGSRVHALIPPLSLCGPVLTIRKFSLIPFAAGDLVAQGTLGPRMLEFLAACVRGKANIVISGGTELRQDDAAERAGVVHPGRRAADHDRGRGRAAAGASRTSSALEARPPNVEGRGEVTVRQLVRNALRMRPDRIIVGEVRGGEALDMLQAMNTGHEGSLSHRARELAAATSLWRLETMALMSDVDLPGRAHPQAGGGRHRRRRPPGAAARRSPASSTSPGHQHARRRAPGAAVVPLPSSRRSGGPVRGDRRRARAWPRSCVNAASRSTTPCSTPGRTRGERAGGGARRDRGVVRRTVVPRVGAHGRTPADRLAPRPDARPARPLQLRGVRVPSAVGLAGFVVAGLPGAVAGVGAAIAARSGCAGTAPPDDGDPPRRAARRRDRGPDRRRARGHVVSHGDRLRRAGGGAADRRRSPASRRRSRGRDAARRRAQEVVRAADSEDARLVAGALDLHRRSGGDLPAVLDEVASTDQGARGRGPRGSRAHRASAAVRERSSASCRSASSRSCRLTSRRDIEGALGTPAGIVSVGLGLVLELAAFLWIRSLLEVERELAVRRRTWRPARPSWRPPPRCGLVARSCRWQAAEIAPAPVARDRSAAATRAGEPEPSTRRSRNSRTCWPSARRPGCPPNSRSDGPPTCCRDPSVKTCGGSRRGRSRRTVARRAGGLRGGGARPISAGRWRVLERTESLGSSLADATRDARPVPYGRHDAPPRSRGRAPRRSRCSSPSCS